MTTPDAARTAVLFAAAAVGLWAAKSVAIGTAGGLGLSPLEGPLFFLGLGASLLALACLLLTWTRGRSRRIRVLAVLSALPVALILGAVSRTAVWLVEPADPGWPWAELNLWLVAVSFLCVAVVVRRRVVRAEPVARAPHTLR